MLGLNLNHVSKRVPSCFCSKQVVTNSETKHCHLQWNFFVTSKWCSRKSFMGIFMTFEEKYTNETNCSCPPSWWRHQIKNFYALLALCAGNSPVTGEFPTQRPVTRSFDVFFDLRLNKRLSKQSWGWWFETPSCSLWCYCNDWPLLLTLFNFNFVFGFGISVKLLMK